MKEDNQDELLLNWMDLLLKTVQKNDDHFSNLIKSKKQTIVRELKFVFETSQKLQNNLKDKILERNINFFITQIFQKFRKYQV